MKRSPLAYLEDIRLACIRIRDTISNVSLARYEPDNVLRDIVERNLIKIGDALNLLHRIDPQLTLRISGYTLIIDTRNRLTHGYATVDNAVIWQAATTDIGVLMREIEALIEEQEALA
jgi:uncharacterized protein with HEPN domain